MAQTIETIEVPSYETIPAEYEEIRLDVGEWNIFPNSPNYKLTARLTQGSDAVIVQSGRGIFVKVNTAQTSVFLQADCPKDTTCKATYTNSFFFSSGGVGGSGGGGGGGSYAFSAPLNESGGNVSLNLANDLQVSGGNLTLDLQNNSDFSSLSSLVQSLTSGVEIIGQIPKPNAEVSVDTNLLTLFVNTEKGRAPRGGDVILTTEANSNPAYVWLYTSTGAWAGIGTAGAGIATQATLGLIKGSSTISIASDGTASVNGVALLSGNNTFTGSNTFPDATTTSNPLTFSTLFKDSTFQPTASNIPNGGGVFVLN